MAPRDAASVIMLRDTPQGLEVFLLKRHGNSDSFGGAYVFPGGKVDAADSSPAMLAHLDQSLAALHLSLNEPALSPEAAAGLYVAAAREAFEESGILFAGNLTSPVDASADFATQLSSHGLQLQTKHLRPWTRWVTPIMPTVSRKRFDTRFFIAYSPVGQTAQHDNHETTESLWVCPRQALEQHAQGLIDMAAPQIMTLAHLARFTTVAQAWQAAGQRPPPTICPEPHDIDGLRVVTYPGDPLHSVRERAMPGPTRLRFRDKKFEAIEGFESFFA
jgi:8-oxo-dGTP pyrophosphatase MutT (NUDIX family)